MTYAAQFGAILTMLMISATLSGCLNIKVGEKVTSPPEAHISLNFHWDGRRCKAGPAEKYLVLLFTVLSSVEDLTALVNLLFINRTFSGA